MSKVIVRCSLRNARQLVAVVGEREVVHQAVAARRVLASGGSDDGRHQDTQDDMV